VHNVMRENKQEPLLQILNFTQYIYLDQNAISNASYIKCFEKDAHLG
jgi:hypothetical protein